MSKQKLQPGMMLDFLSPEELITGLKDQTDILLKRLGKNALFKRTLSPTTLADASGNFNIKITPPAGFIWELRWVQWNGVGTANMNMYMGEPTTVNLLGTNFVAGSNAQFYGSKQIVFYAPDYLIFTQGTVPSVVGAAVSVQLGIVEVPFGHEAQLVI